MIAMKNDLTVEEVMTIKDVLPAAAIVQTRPEIPIEEAIALKANMTIGRNFTILSILMIRNQSLKSITSLLLIFFYL